jgi:hypothetical protein
MSEATESVAVTLINAMDSASGLESQFRVDDDPDDDVRSGGTIFGMIDDETGERFDVIVSRSDR